MRLQIASGLDLKSLAIWAFEQQTHAFVMDKLTTNLGKKLQKPVADRHLYLLRSSGGGEWGKCISESCSLFPVFFWFWGWRVPPDHLLFLSLSPLFPTSHVGFTTTL